MFLELKKMPLEKKTVAKTQHKCVNDFTYLQLNLRVSLLTLSTARTLTEHKITQKHLMSEKLLHYQCVIEMAMAFT